MDHLVSREVWKYRHQALPGREPGEQASYFLEGYFLEGYFLAGYFLACYRLACYFLVGCHLVGFRRAGYRRAGCSLVDCYPLSYYSSHHLEVLKAVATLGMVENSIRDWDLTTSVSCLYLTD